MHRVLLWQFIIMVDVFFVCRRLDVVESLKWTEENATLENERLEATDELNWVLEDDDDRDHKMTMMDETD